MRECYNAIMRNAGMGECRKGGSQNEKGNNKTTSGLFVPKVISVQQKLSNNK